MQILQILTFLAAVIITVGSVSLIFFEEYEDGIFGRIGLSLMATGFGLGVIAVDCIVFFLDDADLVYYYPTPVDVFVFGGLVLFFVRHWYRFRRFYSTKRQKAVRAFNTLVDERLNELEDKSPKQISGS